VVDRLASRRTDAIVAVSEALAEYLRSRRIVADPSRLHVIRNGVDCDRFRPGAAEPALGAELGLAPERPIIGSIGRLEPVKGYDRLVRAFARLHEEAGGPRPVLVLAGDGSERESLGRLAGELGVAADVHLLGWRDDIHALHGSFTVFAMSSFSEGTSVSLLEAMASGLCPVVTDVGGNRAVLGPELSHRIVPSDRPESLVAGLRDALVDAGSRRKDGEVARRRVEERFSLSGMIAAYEQLYRA
jgi:glycosyltransferase involved in cell wall biosynthesis